MGGSRVREAPNGLEAGDPQACCLCDCQLCALKAGATGDTDLEPECWFMCSARDCCFKSRSVTSIEDHVLRCHADGRILKERGSLARERLLTIMRAGRRRNGFSDQSRPSNWEKDKVTGVKTIKLFKKPKLEGDDGEENDIAGQKLALLFSNSSISISMSEEVVSAKEKVEQGGRPGALSVLRTTTGLPYGEIYPVRMDLSDEEEDWVEPGVIAEEEDAPSGPYDDDAHDCQSIENVGIAGDVRVKAEDESQSGESYQDVDYRLDGIVELERDTRTKKKPLKEGGIRVCIFPGCGFSSEGPESLLSHEESEHFGWMLQACTANKDLAFQLLEGHPGGTAWTCKVCGVSLGDEGSAASHVVAEHPPVGMVELQCPECSFSGKLSGDLILHFKVNTNTALPDILTWVTCGGCAKGLLGATPHLLRTSFDHSPLIFRKVNPSSAHLRMVKGGAGRPLRDPRHILRT